MATTLGAIGWLKNSGARDSSGAVIASGKVRFYQPGTLSAAVVYSDRLAATALPQPATLDAGGRLEVFTLEPVRVRIWDSTDTTLMLDWENITRAESVYFTDSDGDEADVGDFLEAAEDALGPNFEYQESAGATPRSYQSWLSEYHVSGEDFDADETGATDTAARLQSAIDQAIDSGSKRLFLKQGTYRIDSALSIDTAGFELHGAGRGRTIIKNQSTTGNAITVNLGSALDSKCTIRDLTITANTTSSGAAIAVTNGDRINIRNVSTLLHRTGITCSAVSGAKVVDCVVESTDDNAAAVGIASGPRGRVEDCEVISGTDNGSGIVLGNDGKARGCYVSNFATGLSLSNDRAWATECHVLGSTTGILISGLHGARASNTFVSTTTTGINITGAGGRADGCVVNGATTGISLGAVDATAMSCTVESATTGISLGAARTQANSNAVSSGTTGILVGAHASCVVMNNSFPTANTTDLSINASATLFVETGNTYATISDSAALGHATFFKKRTSTSRWKIGKTDETGTSLTFTPDPQSYDTHVLRVTNGSATTCTVNATSTTGLVDGQLLAIVFYKDGAGNITISWNAQFIPQTTNVNGNSYTGWLFIWRATEAKWHFLFDGAVSTPGSALWD